MDREQIRSWTGRFLPGVTIAFTVGFAASFLSEHYGAPAMLFALLLGMSLNFLNDDPKSAPGIEFCSRDVLRFAVALLGFRIAIGDLLGLGWQTLAILISGVVTTIIVGLLLVRATDMGRRFGILSGGAVAICGASAALAISAVLPGDEDRERDTAFVVVGVTTLSTLVMIFYPILSGALALSDTMAGVFIGATIHDVAQVVGAGYSISDTSGEVATMTKLIRVAFLLPVVLLISLTFNARGRQAVDGTGEVSRPPLLPGFLVAFLVFAVINSVISLPEVLLETLRVLAQYGLVAAIAAVGLKTNLRSMVTLGWGPVLLMVGETLWLGVFVLACLLYM